MGQAGQAEVEKIEGIGYWVVCKTRILNPEPFTFHLSLFTSMGQAQITPIKLVAF